ncbi:transmembrane protein, putative (macronuclear) [Tetrahymena thermophila SB210]|uniref:Transmembrane protein, putative n=1 Tax=Tetrahymena thermophila (strain SB210) TaxID=312017 RepID=Q22PC7_TETTS|nr:transmembrane protein, putative [Tetrahymena thermophila SB210]EAR87182.2 transmembrane protein, putative [Tetrahymena thermophila SB210]|eukprot:XP_001007427.2 transmembrane protein, putative [Tetrahymena thermophila SB210]
MNFSKINSFLLSLITLINFIFCGQCPLLQTYENPQKYQGFVVKNYLRIPQTNVLVINTIFQQNQDSSIVYYNDMSSSSGEIINVIKPDYVIIEMLYNSQIDQIVISNYDNLIFADPYTLKALSSFSIPNLMTIQFIKGTNYILITNYFNQLQIFDFIQQQVVLLMDNTSQLLVFPDNQWLYQYYSDLYTLKNGDNIIVTTNDMGVIAWGIDLKQLNYTFYGYIQDSLVYAEKDGYKSFTKHPTEDILFMAGKYLEITAVKIIDAKQGLYKTLFKTSLYNYQFLDVLTNIEFVYFNYNGLPYPCLWVGEEQYIYYAYVSFNSDFSSAYITNYGWNDVKSYYRWYKIEENTVFFISSLYYITIFNYQTFQFSYNLYVYGNNYCRRFIRQQQGQTDRFILLDNNVLLLYDRGNFGMYNVNTQKPTLSIGHLQTFSTFYQIKNIFDWYFVKASTVVNGQTQSLALIFPIYPLNQHEYTSNITSSFGLQWYNVNLNLDPYFLNGKVWVAVAFPHKAKTENYLFQLINCLSTTERYNLTSNQTDVTSIQTAFAISSLQNANNQELIGVDNAGTIYTWDLSQPTIPFKSSINFSICTNSVIGEVFYYQNSKYLIISCSNNNVYSFNLATGSYQLLSKLSSQPLALRAFSQPQLVAIGDQNQGIALIYKFNTTSLQFDFFLQLQSKKVQDKIIFIEMLNDYTIWVQFGLSNLFYSIQDCLSDSKLCTQCTQSYSFQATNKYDQSGVYGIGTTNKPFTTSDNFLTAMIKAQYYKQMVNGVSDMSVNIVIQPGFLLNLNPNLMNFDFNKIIQLTFQSSQPGTYASLEYQNTLNLQNYYQINIQDIIIYYGLDTEQNNCGLIFQNIQQGVFINNIQQFTLLSTSIPKSCQSIFVEQTQLTILKYEIVEEDFTNHQSVINTFNSTQIQLFNVSIINSTLGQSFSYLQQQSDIQVNIQNITLSGNSCSDNANQDDNIISVLFSAGQYTVNNMLVSGNTFCKKSFFSTVTTLTQANQVFSFSNVIVQNNVFQARTTYIFFDAFYSMKASPSHELDLNGVSFVNNHLFQQSSEDLNTAQYFQTSKIAKIQIQNTNLTDHFDIQLGLIENANSIQIDTFYCQNDDEYLAKIPSKITAGCLQMKEIQQANFNQIQVTKKKSQDSNLIKIQNSEVQQANLTITNGMFSDLQLYQNSVNTEAIPLYIVSGYDIQVVLDNCTFQNIFLKSIQYTLTFSSTALYILNYVGSITIKNSQFQNSYSNSLYGFAYIQTYTLTIDNVSFNNSTFTNDNSLSLFNSQGSMINAKAQNITIMKTNFTKATASKGAFLYLVSFGEIFYLNFTNTMFSEGYASLDGGAVFIDDGGQILQMNCQNCQFSNIYTLFGSASTIASQKYAEQQVNQQNTISFQGGYIKNVKGIADSYFIDVNNAGIQFQNINQILSEDFSSNSMAHSQFINRAKNPQQSTLVNLLNSNLVINKCNITNIYIESQSATFPLLINSQNSSVKISNSQILNSTFTTSMIYSSQSQLDFSQLTVQNVSQKFSQSRLIQQDIYQTPQAISSSLIVTTQSIIKVYQGSLFSNIQCNTNCNGGAFQVSQGTLNIENTVFQQIQSTFGGALFIQGINNTNQISNTQFLNCNSQSDGGAIYLTALQNDKFSLNLDQTTFNGNECNVRGGAMYISSEILNSAQQSVQMTNSKIINNKAGIGGGIYQQNLSVDTQKNNVLSSNVGQIYGSDEVSYPSQLRVSNIDSFLQLNNGVVDKDHIVINNFRSGANLSDIQFVLLNNKSEIVYPITSEDYNTFQIDVNIDQKTKDLSSYSVSENIFAKYDPLLKAFKFDNISITGLPGSSANIQFTSKQIYTLDQNTQTFIQNYTFNILIQFRLCGPGEQIAKLDQVTQCQICPVNYYSFDVSNCQECPQGATCNGGTNVVANAGYWRKTNISNIIIDCSNLPDNCVGGSFGNNICYEGHIGALCEECDIHGEHWGKPYAKSAKYSCTRCDQIKGNVWIVVLMTVWTLVSMCLAIKGDVDVLREKVAVLTIQKHMMMRRKTVSLTSKEKRQNFMTQKNRFSFSQIDNKYPTRTSIPQIPSQKSIGMQFKTDEDKSGIFIKMLTNYVQIVGSIATFNLSIPSGIFEFPQSVGQPLKQTMNSLDCALEELNASMPIIYLRLLFSLMIPVVYMILFLTCMLIYYLVKKCKKSKQEKQQFPWYILTTAIMFLIIYIQPDLVAQIIALLSCRQIGDTKYILSNVSFVCYTSQHYLYALSLVVPMLLVWVFILPGILFFLLRRNKENLESIEIKLKYGFLYKEYQNYAFYWEFVKMAEKLAIILALNFYSQSIVTKGILVFIVITAYGILSMMIHPYQESDINEIDVNSTNVCALTVLLGLFMYDNQFFYFVYTSLALIVIINLWFIFKILGKIISGYIPKIKAAIETIVEALSKKISFFKRYKKKEQQKKQMKPEVKQKYQALFKKILALKPQEKKKIFLNIIQMQIVESYKHIFGEHEDEEIHLVDKDKQQENQQPDKQLEVKQNLQQKSQRDSLNQKEISIEISPQINYRNTVEQLKISDTNNVNEIEMLKLDNNYTYQETKEEFTNRNINFDSNARLFNLKQRKNPEQNFNQLQIENKPSSNDNKLDQINYEGDSKDIIPNTQQNYSDSSHSKSEESEPIDHEQIELDMHEGDKNVTYLQNKN